MKMIQRLQLLEHLTPTEQILSKNHYNKMSSFSTRMTLLYLLDSLYSLYFQLNYDQNLAFKLEAYERMTKTKKE
ncbi:hypothetical protein OQH00_04975 [Streptococcus macedonicus]|uniref:hypothetical protein n=1 Tax=Streptococcus macedonicus TaxID=59310 RepID=UPI0022433592|nr:hypothetical protein [Streptococcus macedonicus]MCW8519185.1 hypothetical protein [Streptococcus macedonicus]MCW8521036.1 hypothetical protein [Streptococcus macedonicus]